MQAINFYGNLAQFRPFITGRDTDDNELIRGADWLVPGPSFRIAHSVEEFVNDTRRGQSFAYLQRYGFQVFPRGKALGTLYLAFTIFEAEKSKIYRNSNITARAYALLNNDKMSQLSLNSM